MTRVALCFPGQGSQAPGMAEDLVDTPLGSRLLAVAAHEGLDLAGALSGSAEALRPTEVAQPALLLVELVLAAALPGHIDVVGVAGHSVGEYAAVSVAGAYTADDTMRLVIRRGREMALMTQGTMAAVLGLGAAELEEVCAGVRSGGEVVVVANLNAPGQIVISGSSDGVAAAGEVARQRGARRVVPLNVSGAFHSPLMAPAATRLAEAIRDTELHPLALPVVCNVDAAVVNDAGELPDRLSRQLEAPVRWMDCVDRLVALGADTLVEVGPGAVLSGLAKRIAPDVATITVNDLAGAALLSEFRTTPA